MLSYLASPRWEACRKMLVSGWGWLEKDNDNTVSSQKRDAGNAISNTQNKVSSHHRPLLDNFTVPVLLKLRIQFILFTHTLKGGFTNKTCRYKSKGLYVTIKMQLILSLFEVTVSGNQHICFKISKKIIPTLNLCAHTLNFSLPMGSWRQRVG